MNRALHDALLDLLIRRLDNRASGASLVDWAIRALEAGVETEALIILAGLSPDCSVFEAEPLLDRGMAELNLAVPGSEELRRAYVGVVSRALLAGAVEAREALDRIHRAVVTPLGHPSDLAPWCFVWEGLHPDDYRTLDNPETDSEARRLASAWATYPSLSREM